LTRVVAINVGVHILYVDNQGVDHWEQCLDVGGRHVERCFQIEPPLRAAQLTKLTDKLRAQARLSATKSDASVCSNEIKLVNAGLGIELFRRILAETLGIAKRLRVKTIATTERTAMKSHKRCDTIAVGRDAMSRKTYYSGSRRVHESRELMCWHGCTQI
jgi:hypothetical protein